jgi:hypothetical protein
MKRSDLSGILASHLEDECSVVDISQPCFVDSEYLTRWRPCATQEGARDKVRGGFLTPSGNVAALEPGKMKQSTVGVRAAAAVTPTCIEDGTGNVR